VLTMIRPDDAAGEGELGRERFVLLIGLQDGGFVYHDPVFPDRRGAGRRLPAATLTRVWANGPNPAQAAGLALGRAELGLFASRDALAQAQRQPDSYSDVRDVATAVPQATAASEPALGEAAQLIPIEQSGADQATVRPAEPSRGPWGWLPTNPLLLSFWVIASLIFIRIVAGLILD